MSTPPPAGTQITVYQWAVSIFPCSACTALAYTPSLSRRESPHAMCLCPGDIPTTAACTFQGRMETINITTQHEEPLFVLPPGVTRTFNTSSVIILGGSISGEAEGISVTVNETTQTATGQTASITNPGTGYLELRLLWEDFQEEWIDTIHCNVLGFNIISQVPGQDADRRDLGHSVVEVPAP